MPWNSSPAPLHVVDLALPFDFDQPALVAAEAARAIRLAEANGAAADAIIFRTQLARAQALQSEVYEAECTLHLARKALAHVEDATATLRFALEYGRVLTAKHLPYDARSRFATAWELACREKDGFLAIDAAQMMAVIEPPKARAAWFSRALPIAERSSDPRVMAWRAPLLQAIGDHAMEDGRFEDALAAFDRSYASLPQQTQLSRAVTSRCSKARALRALGRLEEATTLLLTLDRELREARSDDAFVHEELGECLMASDRAPEARQHFAHAYAKLSSNEWIRDNQPARLSRLEKLGKQHS